MKKLVFLITLVFLLLPVTVFGAKGTIEGTIEGYNCVMQGKTCPVGKEDPLVATESTFIILTPDNKYYFVPNVDRAVLARHVAERVRINGDINQQTNSIKAQTIETSRNGQWKVVYNASSPFNPEQLP